MMGTNQTEAMLAHCDELTRDGKELSVTWEGGNDSGCLYLKLDGEEIVSLAPIEEDILRLVEEDIGYGSFAGDFTTYGSVVYDREAKCFTGTDEYSEYDQGQRECAIAVHIPERVWFDRVDIGINSEGYDNDLHLETSVSLQVLNGPYPDDFDQIKSNIEKHINNMLTLAVDNIEDFEGMWESFSIPRTDFESKDGTLCYMIDAFSYSYSKSEIQDVHISFQELS